MPKESAVLARVRRRLIEVGAKCIKTSGEGEPDLVCSIEGHTVVIETKQSGETPDPLQFQRLREWATAGALALWTDDGRMFHAPYNLVIRPNVRAILPDTFRLSETD